jgi:hypothetical protein
MVLNPNQKPANKECNDATNSAHIRETPKA